MNKQSQRCTNLQHKVERQNTGDRWPPNHSRDLGRVLNTLESFADLQFKHVSTYAFSEVVRTPTEKVFAVQQKPPMKTIFPKLQTLTTFPDESKPSSMISQENINNAFNSFIFSIQNCLLMLLILLLTCLV